MQHPPKTTLPESTSFSQSRSELAGYLRHLGASARWAFQGYRYVFGTADKDSTADQPQIRTGSSQTRLTGLYVVSIPSCLRTPGCNFRKSGKRAAARHGNRRGMQPARCRGCRGAPFLGAPGTTRTGLTDCSVWRWTIACRARHDGQRLF